MYLMMIIRLYINNTILLNILEEQGKENMADLDLEALEEIMKVYYSLS
jgi:hypothetical protein